jgi:hypothetical protein
VGEGETILEGVSLVVTTKECGVVIGVSWNVVS